MQRKEAIKVGIATLISVTLGWQLGSALDKALTRNPSNASVKKDIPNLKLFYFDIPGKAEAIRLACSYGNIPLEDIRIDGAKFAEMKKEGLLQFGQVPVLLVDDKTYIAQSSAIAKYVGKFSGLYPINDDLLAAQIDAILDGEADLFLGLTASRYRDRMGFGAVDESTIAKVRKSLNDEILPKHLQNFENILAKSSSQWLVGGPEPSIADIILSIRLKWLISGANEGISKDLLKPYPKLCKMIDSVDNHPAVKKYNAGQKK